jgi:BirA family biotin operon repressor/biotin-[acetyl-CoA-carboxylase] ligase
MAPVYLKYNELPSTHDYAISLISKTTPQEATVIVAAHQTAGKGRYERSWSSTPGSNALISCILYPSHLPVQQAFLLNIMSTLATTQLLNQLGIQEALIKWPNDVLIRDKKIAGTLIQNQFSGSHIASSVVSLGLNVNQTNWPVDIPATSLSLIQGTTYDVEDIVDTWVHLLLSLYETSFAVSGRQAMKRSWTERLMGFGVDSRYVRQDGSTFLARLIDVQDSGYLILEVDGQSRQFHMDDIRHQGARHL